MLTAESETAAAAAALASARGGSSLAQRTAVGGWPGLGVGPAAAAAVAQTPGFTSAVSGFLGWEPSDRQIGAATVGIGAEAIAAADHRREMAARGLLAIPSSGHGGDVVDLTGGIGGRSLAEQDEEQMQLAIAMSLSAVESSGAGGGGGEGGEGSREGLGDDTETEEDADYGAQLPGGDGDAETAERSGSPPRKRSEADSSSSEGAGSGQAQGGRAGRGSAEAGHRNDGSRRIRRRRDESGASTSGEQSPSGADGGTAGGAEMELDDSRGIAPPSLALAPLNEAVHGNVSSFRRADSLGASVSDPSGRGSGGSRAAGAAACGHHYAGSPANVGIDAATGGVDENDPGAVAAAAAAALAPGSNGGILPCSSARPPRPPSPCPSSSSSSCSFSLESRNSRRRRPPARAENQAAAVAADVSLGHGDPNGAKAAAPVSQEGHGEIDDTCRYHPAAAQGYPRGRPQLQVSIPGDGDGGGMISALGGVIAPPPAAATAISSAAAVAEAGGLGTGEGDDLGAGGGFINDDLGANDMLLRDFDGHGALDDKLLAVAGWQGDVSSSYLLWLGAFVPVLCCRPLFPRKDARCFELCALGHGFWNFCCGLEDKPDDQK